MCGCTVQSCVCSKVFTGPLEIKNFRPVNCLRIFRCADHPIITTQPIISFSVSDTLTTTSLQDSDNLLGKFLFTIYCFLEWRNDLRN